MLAPEQVPLWAAGHGRSEINSHRPSAEHHGPLCGLGQCLETSRACSGRSISWRSPSTARRHAIVAATCSGASKAAAGYPTHAGHASFDLAIVDQRRAVDGQAHPYFARTSPSDAWQSSGLVDLAHLLGVERLATVNSRDSYGDMGMREFRRHAAGHDMQILASTTFANGQRDFSSSVDVLLRSGALVVVLFCQMQDASPFIEAVQAAGGENITWVGSEAVTHAVGNMSPQQLHGFAGLSPAGGAGDAYTGFQSRLGAFEATVVSEGWCSDATDDDGQRLWKTADCGASLYPGPVPPAHCHLIAQSPESRPVCAQGACILVSGATTSDSYALCIRCRVRHRASRRPDAEICSRLPARCLCRRCST